MNYGKNALYIFPTALLALSSCKPNEPAKPNIICIIADDLAYDAVHAYGNDEVITPNIDRLAAEGMQYANAYNMGAWHGAVCVASRTMLNTGKYLWNAMDAENSLDQFAGEGLFWSQLMEQAGYETYFSGKWHVDIAPENVFNYTRHVRGGMPETVPEAYNRPVKGETDPWSPADSSLGGFWEGSKHWSEVVAEDAGFFLEKAKTTEEPFFMYLAFNAPHDPRQSPEEYLDMYSLDHIDVPLNFMPEYPYKELIGCGEDLRDERLAPFPRTPYAVKVHRKEYYAIITHMDAQVGRILEALDKSGMKDNTYVFFASDHGLACGQHSLMGKQNMYDHSMKAPVLIAGPDVPANNRIERNIYLQDIMPTILELAGIEVPQHVEFNSLLPLIKDPEGKGGYDEIYGGYMDLQRMIRDERYKLIAFPEVPKLMLFDLVNDSLEMENLAEIPEYSETVSRMFERLEEISARMQDTLIMKDYFHEYMDSFEYTRE